MARRAPQGHCGTQQCTRRGVFEPLLGFGLHPRGVRTHIQQSSRGDMSDFLVNASQPTTYFCVLATVLAVRDVRPDWHAELALEAGGLRPRRPLVTFAGRFTDDETWGVVTGLGMSVLTFATAGWSIGSLYKVLVGERPCPTPSSRSRWRSSRAAGSTTAGCCSETARTRGGGSAT